MTLSHIRNLSSPGQLLLFLTLAIGFAPFSVSVSGFVLLPSSDPVSTRSSKLSRSGNPYEAMTASKPATRAVTSAAAVMSSARSSPGSNGGSIVGGGIGSGAAACGPIKVAVIGAGAAGLATARVLSRSGMIPTVLEKDETNTSGGVWKHVANDKCRPMYRGLRTNLPREIMAFREKPWGGDGKGMSYVKHTEVLSYLNDYEKYFDLTKYISYGCKVTQLTVNTDTVSAVSPTTTPINNNNGDISWPKITLRWEVTEQRSEKQSREQTFDAVCICNGHYAAPSIPDVPGLHRFRGRVMHSVEYDDPKEFADQTVLCVGARASGSDLAREISARAEQVYLSDSTCPPLENGRPRTCGNVTLVPRTISIDSDSVVHFADSCAVAPSDVDVIIFCSGYDYKFPFINDKSNLDLQCTPGERRVSPLYEQLWHARYPTVAFVGLPHSVLPFPFFELQAEAVVAQFMGSSPYPLPSLVERLAAAKVDAESGGPKDPGRVQDTHYLGGYQWDYCRKMARFAGLYDEEMEDYIATNKAIYDHASRERKSIFPGGPDTYRSTRFIRDDANRSYEVVATEMESVDDAALMAR